jgi:hypothetical protein
LLHLILTGWSPAKELPNDLALLLAGEQIAVYLGEI